ncbi:MAG: SMI1/KNR4 family protein [Robiginitomaculum sp.]|nr:SMI1/KNR4 family protein [Robiginitomaculum sp.]
MTDLITAYKNFLNCGSAGITPRPPASEQQIAEFSEAYNQEHNIPPPTELLQMARIANGASWGDEEGWGFEWLTEVTQETGPALERSINLLPDGCGNSLIVDVTSDGKLGPVLFNSHDPMGITIYAPSLKTFFEREMKSATKHGKILLDETGPLELLFNFTDLGLNYEQVMAGTSKGLKSYAKKIGSNHLFVDFRTCKTGLSFHYHPTKKEPMARDWPALRDGDNLIFAIPLLEHPPTIVQRIKSLFGK